MNNEECAEFLGWCTEHLQCDLNDCDESSHLYFNGEMIGGYAGDRREYFMEQNDTVARVFKMYNEWKHFGDPRWMR